MKHKDSDILANAGKRAHENAVSKGFWERGAEDAFQLVNQIAHMHAECSELMECVVRDPHAPGTRVPEITEEAEQCADLFLRLVDYCYARGIDLKHAAQLKHKYNEGRPHKHGKKV